MTSEELLIIILIIQLIHGLGTWKLYIKAGRKAWEAFVPIYNAVILMRIINRPFWWVILLFLPIVNLIMFPVVWVETARSFGKNTYADTALEVVSLGFYNYYLNYVAKDLNYIENRDINPKSSSGDWTASILFAIVAATIIHTYVMQPYTIPTSSLEKTLLKYDFLFVSKFHYGARVPNTAIAAPMVHDTIPLIKKKSYLYNDNNPSSWLNKLQLPYMRIPGFQSIKNNDIVVFNWPADTLYHMYKKADRKYAKPVDKRTNYVKRCVGIAGDSLEIKDGYVYINGKKNMLPDRAKLQFYYGMELDGNVRTNAHLKQIMNRYGITEYGPNHVFATNEAARRAAKHPNIKQLIPYKREKGEWDNTTFPHNPNYPWNNDNFGPIYIPEQGKTVDLNVDVLPLYEKIITEYEHNTLSVQGNQILINEKPANSYTFKQNYYWLMGDNRHNSLDARSWGFVPFDHVVGKPVFIWMSWDGIKNPRWERFFTTVHGSGKPVSYLIPFIVLLIGYRVYVSWRKRKKTA